MGEGIVERAEAIVARHLIDLLADAFCRIRELLESLFNSFKRLTQTIVDALEQLGLLQTEVSNTNKYDYRRDPYNGKRVDYHANHSAPYVLPRANRYHKSQSRKR